jgi:DNA-binding transcriptional regulator YiaG
MYTIDNPTPEEIKQARKDAGLTQTQAAEIIYCSLGAWKKWESWDREMHQAFFELFLIKTKAKDKRV